MEEIIDIINEIFDVKTNTNDENKLVTEVLDWDSFSIVNFMSDMFDKYRVNISISQISEISTLGDLIKLIKECQVMNKEK